MAFNPIRATLKYLEKVIIMILDFLVEVLITVLGIILGIFLLFLLGEIGAKIMEVTCR